MKHCPTSLGDVVKSHRQNTKDKLTKWHMHYTAAYCQKNELPHKMKWSNNRAEVLPENEKPKMLWNFNGQTDQIIEARRPKLILV